MSDRSSSDHAPTGTGSSGAFAFTIRDAASYSGLGRTTLYDLEKSGKLRMVRIGRRVLVLRSELERLLSEGCGSIAGPTEREST